jgi:hypothetical protein
MIRGPSVRPSQCSDAVQWEAAVSFCILTVESPIVCLREMADVGSAGRTVSSCCRTATLYS